MIASFGFNLVRFGSFRGTDDLSGNNDRYYVFDLIFIIATAQALTADNSSHCIRQCGDGKGYSNRVPYPFGFSDGCGIRLNCSEYGDAKIGEFRVQNVTPDSILINLPENCSRPIGLIEQLFQHNYALTWRNSLLLQDCRPSPPMNDDCVISTSLMKSRFPRQGCESSNDNISCYSEESRGLQFMNFENLVRTNCRVLLSSIAVDFNNSTGNSSEVALDFQTVEMGWWLDGPCRCDANANFMVLQLAGGPSGCRCRCKEGFQGDGFVDGDGCHKGVFRNESGVDVSGNGKLCGGTPELHLQPCPAQTAANSKKHIVLKLVLAIVIVVSFIVLLLSLISLRWRKKMRTRLRSKSASSFLQFDFYPKVSYEDLLNATDGFSSHNFIGSGNFGAVYKGTLAQDGSVVAIKVLKLQQQGASKSFMAECQALRNIRHRNLVNILTACSSMDFQGNNFKALVYQYMPNGSLEEWLHPEHRHVQQKSPSLVERMNIVIDVASALDYIHHECQTPLAHCDLKPSNVLLDNDLTAHVSDFGLARFLTYTSQEDANPNQFSSLGLKGTIGYAAPEYGMGGQVSTQGDVYSFGILLLEMFTGRRPTDEVFEDKINLHNFVKQALPDQVMEIVDQSTPYDDEEGDALERIKYGSDSRNEKIECLISVFQIGVSCSEEFPQGRPNMRQVIRDLHSVRDKFLGIGMDKKAKT